MTGLEDLPFLEETGHVISLVGGGGKTTLLYALARHYSAQGQRVLVSTTTHIQRPDANYAPDEAARDALWQAGTYAVAGVPAEGGKLTSKNIVLGTLWSHWPEWDHPTEYVFHYKLYGIFPKTEHLAYDWA